MKTSIYSYSIVAALCLLSLPAKALVYVNTPGTTYTSGSSGAYSYPVSPTNVALENAIASGTSVVVEPPAPPVTTVVTSEAPAAPLSASEAAAAASAAAQANAATTDKIVKPVAPTVVKSTEVIIPEPETNDIVRDIIIETSLQRHGYCACPYSINNDGYECGIESAYYRPGGYRIKCYTQNIRGQEYIFYRKTHP